MGSMGEGRGVVDWVRLGLSEEGTGVSQVSTSILQEELLLIAHLCMALPRKLSLENHIKSQ